MSDFNEVTHSRVPLVVVVAVTVAVLSTRAEVRERMAPVPPFVIDGASASHGLIARLSRPIEPGTESYVACCRLRHNGRLEGSLFDPSCSGHDISDRGRGGYRQLPGTIAGTALEVGAYTESTESVIRLFDVVAESRGC